MGQHHTLGQAFDPLVNSTTAGASGEIPSAAVAAGRRARGPARAQLGPEADPHAEILEPHEAQPVRLERLDELAQLGLLDEGARADDRARLHRACTRRE